MIKKGHITNNTGRFKHIFKRTVRPGESITLKVLYNLYKNKCNCMFDHEFIAWLKEHKIPDENEWDLQFETVFDEPIKVTGKVICVDDNPIKIQKGLTSGDIAELKMRDAPEKVLKTIDSIPKLRRALTITKRKKGKNFLVKCIKSRINTLMNSNQTSANG